MAMFSTIRHHNSLVCCSAYLDDLEQPDVSYFLLSIAKLEAVGSIKPYGSTLKTESTESVSIS